MLEVDVWAELFLRGSELDGQIQRWKEKQNVKAKQCHFF